jgi:rhodanese-related sulfurtransferase
MAPFSLADALGAYGSNAVYFLIGIGFGTALEMSGFGNSTKLAAQFYFKDMTVLKVMFTAIVTAMLLVFLTSGLGWLDYDRVWVPPTYLWPGIIGGLIMGVGFIIGGFCPGTSLVAVATLKVDGLFFFLGVTFGIFIFGETVAEITGFWTSSDFGRWSIPEWLGLSTGVTVLGVVLMAIAMFGGAELSERFFGDEPRRSGAKVLRRLSMGLVCGGLLVLWIGQPTIADKWDRVATEKQLLLDNREVQIEPAELLHLLSDNKINLLLIDVRSEASFNLFHLEGSRRYNIEELTGEVDELLREPPSTVIILTSEDEVRSTEAWKLLVAEDVPNVYLLEGGLNHWLEVFGHFGHEDCPPLETLAGETGEERLQHLFRAAVGSAHPSADPDAHGEDLEFEEKVKIERKKALGGGGCG